MNCLKPITFLSHAAEPRSLLNSTDNSDFQALFSIKQQIQSDPYEFLAPWNNSLHFCSWQGVGCSVPDQRVIALNLSGKGLGGILSPYLGNLTFLRDLKLENNFFYGSIPQEIGLLNQLQYISLQNNSFQGEIPRNLTYCSQLRVINLDRNHLEGKIPGELSSFPNLQELHVSLNFLNGSIPSSLGNLSALRLLSLSDNHLEGSIPPELGNLSSLEFLKLSSNKLSGALPAMFFNISSMQHLMLTANLLNGSFPWDLSLRLPKLQTFSVGQNQFSGPIPSSITNASGLVILDINMNAFLGPVPENIGNLRQLQRLDFSSNPLGSKENNGLNFLTSLSNCTNLRVLHLNANNHRGIFPSSVANLSTELISLRLDGNYISGGIPKGLEKLTNLVNLALSQNMLTGTVPEFVGKLTKLQGLYLSNNNFTGMIPSSIGNISQLSILEMEWNMLEGSIPVSLSNCSRLLKLDLSHNRLTGAIPEEVIGLRSLALGLSLAQNQLTGTLPISVGNLWSLISLDVSENNLSGLLPPTLGSCVEVQFLSLQGNHFHGAIPVTFGRLRSLEFLDLSGNNLSETIPLSLTNCSLNQYLNLSFNALQGEVPKGGVFMNSTLFSIIGNEGLCGGLKSLKLPDCEKKRSSSSSSRKIRVSLPILLVALSIGSLILLFLAYVFILRNWTRKARSPSNPITEEEASSDSLLGDHYPKLSYPELFQATDGFSSVNLIAAGRYSSVYKGILRVSEKSIAVKVINLEHRGARKSFVSECEALRNIRHRNLVKIITSCSGTDFKGNEFKALVYELMPFGSLENWLHQTPTILQQPKSLDLIQRLNIAIDIASAIDYLHHCCEIPVIHRDIKPSNILLDDELCAHLGDFGSARSLLQPIDKYTHIRIRSSAIGIIGTVGYVALGEYNIPTTVKHFIFMQCFRF